MLKYMLDTNIVIYAMKNRPAEVRSGFVKHYGQIAISSITYMELVYGAERSAKPEANLAVVEGLAARLEVLKRYFCRRAYGAVACRARKARNVNRSIRSNDRRSCALNRPSTGYKHRERVPSRAWFAC